LIYRDNFDQALAELVGAGLPGKPAPGAVVTGQPPPAASQGNDAAALADRVRQIRDQAEQLVKELEQLEKDAGTKK